MTDITTESNITLSFFGDPESSVTTHHLSDYVGVFYNDYGNYYIPPVSMLGLIQLMRANPHHGTLPSFRANMLLKYFEQNALVSRKNLKHTAIDYSSTGNGYFQLIRNRLQQVVEVKHLPAINMRRMKNDKYGYLTKNGVLMPFKKGEVWHLAEYDPAQQIYGIPYWFGAVQSILLGEDARLFPRKFFKNGAHMGNVFATSGLQPKEEKAIKDQLERTKGIGNFRTMHIGLPSGKVEEVIKIIPIGEIGSKVEFTKFMNQSATDILEAWRFRPELVGMMPEVGSSGDLAKIMMMNYENEVIPFQQEFEQLNEHLPAKHHIKFTEDPKFTNQPT